MGAGDDILGFFGIEGPGSASALAEASVAFRFEAARSVSVGSTSISLVSSAAFGSRNENKSMMMEVQRKIWRFRSGNNLKSQFVTKCHNTLL